MRDLRTFFMCILLTAIPQSTFANNVQQVAAHNLVSVISNITHTSENSTTAPLANTWRTPVVSSENINAEQFSLLLIAIGVFLIWLAGQGKKKRDRD